MRSSILAPDLFLGIVFGLGFIGAFALFVMGMYLVLQGIRGNARVKFFGQEMSSSNIGFGPMFLGAVVVGLIVYRAPDSLIQLQNVLTAAQLPSAAPTQPVNLPAQIPVAPNSNTLHPQGIPSGREQIASLIIQKFAEAGFGHNQQIAALSDAILESNLNPNAVSQNDYGLFQLNMIEGFGRGYTPAQLLDPTTNIAIVILYASKSEHFKSATTLADAVSIFAREISRPANLEATIQKQLKLANEIASFNS
jgi:hypothetical protein